MQNLASGGAWQDKCSANFKMQLEYAQNEPVLKFKLYQNKFISVLSFFKVNYFTTVFPAFY